MGMTFTLNRATGLVALADESAAEEGTETEGHDDAAPNPVLPTVPDIFWAIIFFGALWALMKYVLIPPIVAGREQRAAKAQAGQDAINKAQGELLRVRSAHEEKLSKAKAEGASIVDAARAEADAERAEAVGQVEEQIAQLRANATSEIDGARTASMSGVRGDVTKLAGSAASKVLGKPVDASAHQSVIDRVLGV